MFPLSLFSLFSLKARNCRTSSISSSQKLLLRPLLMLNKLPILAIECTDGWRFVTVILLHVYLLRKVETHAHSTHRLFQLTAAHILLRHSSQCQSRFSDARAQHLLDANLSSISTTAAPRAHSSTHSCSSVTTLRVYDDNQI